MQAGATLRPEDRLAFANQLAEVRALDVKGEYTQQLNEIEVEYQFTLLRSLDLFHKEMLRSKLPGRLHAIKEKLCDTAGSLTYHTNLPLTSWNWNIKICRHCRKNSLKPMPFSNELCCANCGLLEPLDGVSFDYNEIYKTGDYKVVKQRQSTRRYNFRHYLEKHVKLLSENGHTLSSEIAVKANEFFEAIEKQLPKRISMPFVAYKILEQIVQSGEEHYILNYFSTKLCGDTRSEVGAHASTVRCCVSSDPTAPLESSFSLSLLPQNAKPYMPAPGKLGGNTVPTTFAL